MPPRLADGVDLIGEFEGSGYKEAPSLIRRGDGQVVQLTPLLYSVASHADGRRDYAALAEAVGAEIGRTVSADNIRFLVEERLVPLGIVTKPDGSQPDAEKADPLLALKFRTAVVPEGLANGLARAFMPLFHWPVVVGVLAAFVAADVWLFGVHGIAQAVRQSVYQPAVFLPLFGAVVVSAAFHEVGHAAACRYGGAVPGKMGCGLYLAWPAFYTDVTDAYRLSRRARLRTDLGGVYFNVIVVVATVAAYLATGFEPLLLLVIVMHLEIAHQLLPIVRLDGYYVVADLTGVPDLFNRIGPILRSMLPWNKADERVTVLKRWVRVAVTAWVLVVVPLLVFQLLMILLHLPRILGTAWDSATKQWDAMAKAFSGGDTLAGVGAIVQLAVLALPVVAIVLMLVRVFQRLGQWTWRRTDGRPVLRGLAVLAGAAGLYLLAMAWLPSDNYQPIGPREKGTLTEGVAAVRDVARGDGRFVRPDTSITPEPAGADTDRGDAGTTGVTSTTVPADEADSTTTTTTDGGDSTTTTTDDVDTTTTTEGSG